jgi:hypothetical protein
MKTRFALYSLILLAFSALSLRAETADEVVNKYLNAIGGKDAWKKVNSMKVTGSMDAQGTKIPVVYTKVQNTGLRQDITLMGMSGYVIMTPAGGWTYMPFAGQQKPEAMTADDVKEGLDELDVQGILVDYKDKGHTIELVGKEDVEGTECFKLKVTLKGGNIRTLFFDPSSFYMIREVAKMKANGQEGEQTVNFSNFQKLPEGIVVPWSIGTPFGELKVEKYEVNSKIDPSLFKAG